MVDLVPLLVVILATVVAGEQGKVTYDGYSVLELIPKSGDDINWMKSMSCRSLTDWVGVDMPAHLLCNRKQARNLKVSARKKGIQTKYVSKHFGREIKKEARSVDQMADRITRRKVNAQKNKKNKTKNKKTKVKMIRPPRMLSDIELF
eukprot:TRINITY_DN24162_c0_g1_i1.p1 TRINITY_DN24162_c0_g1~~TRINITY_DN24162_c0_g1_i1.p1  ORF type:complete len:148 (+),score=55.65 TRINITY_DN24162_c0_g1_i1:171-614(+)